MKLFTFLGKLLFSFFIIYVCLIVGKFISTFLPIKFPGSIIGLIILFILLKANLIKISWISPSANLLLKHMSCLFIPAAVGIITYLSEVYDSMFLIILNSFSGIALIILIVGRLFQHYTETPQERKHRKNLYKRASVIKKIKKTNIPALIVNK
ncbi:MAG: CidA/LrgA family protein [Succinivibrionaceae bacterium]